MKTPSIPLVDDWWLARCEGRDFRQISHIPSVIAKLTPFAC